MNKKTVIQIILIFLIFLISLSFYLKYFSNNSKVLKDTPLEEKIAANQNNTSTYIDKKETEIIKTKNIEKLLITIIYFVKLFFIVFIWSANKLIFFGYFKQRIS